MRRCSQVGGDEADVLVSYMRSLCKQPLNVRAMFVLRFRTDFGAYCLQVHRVPPMDSMILIEGGPSVPPTPGYAPWFCRSTGILRIAARLHPRWLFAFLWILLLIPEVIRDAGYKVFAALRYRVFGKVSSSSSSSSGSNCRLVTKATRGRFVEYQVKDLEKAWRKKEKETEQQEGGKSCSTPAAASPPPLSSLKITAQESRDIRARTDAEMELRHGHAHSPGHRMGEVTTTEAEAHGVGAESEPAHQHEASAEQSEGAAADGIQRRKQQKATQ